MRQNAIVFILICLVLFFLFQKCSIDDKCRDTNIGVEEICNNLFVETFSVFNQGAFGGGRYSKWLTDSVNFRLFLGVYDEIEGGFYFNCYGETILVSQLPDNIDGNPKSLTTNKCYFINKLKNLKNINDY